MIRVLQLIDSLEAGGAERLSVSYANALAHDIERSFLCATRTEGVLKSTIDDSVGYLFLEKRSSLDLRAIFRLKRFVKRHRISIIHAHSTSFFLAFLVKLVYPKVNLIWHDHYGNSEFLDQRPKFILKLCSLLFSHIFSVNQILKDWSKHNLYCKQVSYLQNFVVLNSTEKITDLKGVLNKRVVCLANLRAQKDHLNLLKAFSILIKEHPDWTLHCIGKDFNDDYSKKVHDEVKNKNLTQHIFFYGSCLDISNILSQCTIGVLSSKSEGLPIALLEYGFSKLPVIITDVGDCKLVIDSSTKGLIVKPQNSEYLYKALKRLIEDEDERRLISDNLNKTVTAKFSKTAVVDQVIEVYGAILNC